MSEKKQKSNFTMWFFFTLLLGALPLIFLILTDLFLGNKISLASMTKELFFLTIILCADILKTLYEINNEEKRKYTGNAFIHGMTIFILILASVLYGIMLMFDERKINDYVCMLSIILCYLSVIMGAFTQWIIKRQNQ